MSPDEAADVLGDLSEEKAEDLFNRMEDEKNSLEVAELLAYEDDTAGGLMTTDLWTLHVT